MSMWRPHTTALIIIGAVVCIAAVVALLFWLYPKSMDVSLGKGDFHLRVADTEDSRTRGLSNTAHLDKNSGIIMVFESSGLWGIWMKDMKIPIDIIWLDEARTVVHIEENVSPEGGTSTTFSPTQLSKYVIELPAGTVKSEGVVNGDTATFGEEKRFLWW